MLKLAAGGLIIAALVCGCSRTSGPHAEYAARIGRQWHPVAVTEGQTSLASGVNTASCQVKAYGWRTLGQRHVKSRRETWFQRGRAQQEWGWRLLVHNAGSEPRIVNIRVVLMTDEGRRLQISSLLYAIPISDKIGGPPPEPPPPKNVVEPGETRLFTGRSKYWIDEHLGEGEPDRIEWSVYCFGMNPDEPVVSLKMTGADSQPSN